MSIDPVIRAAGISQSANPYSYTENNPVNGVDPTGTTTIDPSAVEEMVVVGPDPSLSSWEPGGGATTFLDLVKSHFRAADAHEFGPLLESILPGLLSQSETGASHDAQGGGGNNQSDAGTIWDGVEEFIAEGGVNKLFEIAKDANATVSILYGGGIGLAGFVGFSIDPIGDLNFDFGIGVGAGEMSVVSFVAQAELQAGEIGAIRLEFIAGGAATLGAIQRSSVAPGGAARGGGALAGQGVFGFIGPTFSIPLGNLNQLLFREEN